MSVEVTIDISLEILGEDVWSHEPNRVWLQLQNSPANVWQYELQGPPPPAGGSSRQVYNGGDNFILVPGWLPTTPLVQQGLQATFFWVDPQPVWGVSNSGATFTLKGPTTDIGIPISSYYPSLIPIAQSNGGSYVTQSTSHGTTQVWNPTPQTDFDLQSSITVQLAVGWF